MYHHREMVKKVRDAGVRNCVEGGMKKKRLRLGIPLVGKSPSGRKVFRGKVYYKNVGKGDGWPCLSLS